MKVRVLATIIVLLGHSCGSKPNEPEPPTPTLDTSVQTRQRYWGPNELPWVKSGQLQLTVSWKRLEYTDKWLQGTARYDWTNNTDHSNLIVRLSHISFYGTSNQPIAFEIYDSLFVLSDTNRHLDIEFGVAVANLGIANSITRLEPFAAVRSGIFSSADTLWSTTTPPLAIAYSADWMFTGIKLLYAFANEYSWELQGAFSVRLTNVSDRSLVCQLSNFRVADELGSPVGQALRADMSSPLPIPPVTIAAGEASENTGEWVLRTHNRSVGFSTFEVLYDATIVVP